MQKFLIDEFKVNELFLNLLSAAILNKPVDADMFEDIEATTWKRIEDIARKQSVNALIADKALSLPERSLPPRDLRMLFLSQIEQTKALNRKFTNVLLKLNIEYSKDNYSFVLLKGLSNAVNYPDPLLRNPGDIDLLLFKKGDYEKSISSIKSKGIQVKIGDPINYSFIFEGISIENHRRITFFDNIKYDNLFHKWEKELFEIENFISIEIGGEKINQLPVVMNALFIFQHLFRHFAHTGIGFRQYCDWLLFLYKHHKEIDCDVFTSIAKTYALLYPMQVFALAAVKYLQVQESIFPFKMITDDKYVHLVIEDIFDGGNFGYHKQGKKRPEEKLNGMWFSFISTIMRSIKFGALSPQHIRILPIVKIINRLKIWF